MIARPLTSNVQVGDVIMLSCNVSEGTGNAYLWIRTRDSVIVGNSSVVNVSIGSSQDGGIYSCSVTNDDGYGSANVTINGIKCGILQLNCEKCHLLFSMYFACSFTFYFSSSTGHDSGF